MSSQRERERERERVDELKRNWLYILLQVQNVSVGRSIVQEALHSNWYGVQIDIGNIWCGECGMAFRFFLASFYTKYDQYHFVVNAVSLLAVLIPKLPQFDGVRLFGINAY